MRRAVLTTVVLAVVATPLGAAPAAAQPERDGVDRVLILSVPTLSWEDLESTSLPNLNALVDRSAVADLTTRGVGRTTGASEGYGILGAGTRVVGTGDDGRGFEPDEAYAGTTAAEVFARRTGVEVSDGLLSLSQADRAEANDPLSFGAEVSALGEALDDAGVDTAVVANADTIASDGSVNHHREAVIALTDPEGTVPAGSVGPDLLEDDPDAPYGIRLDHDAVEEAFTEAWEPERDRAGAVVLVEASDLARVDAYRGQLAADRRDDFHRRALQRTDELAGRLLDQVDPERDAVLLLGPYHDRADVHLTVAALSAPDVEPGLLRSATTRRSGFVQPVDAAPTVLDRLGLDLPPSMEGRPFERGDVGGSSAERRSFLIEADEAARFRDEVIAGVTTGFIVLNLVLWLVAGLALTRMGDRAARWVRVAALGVLGFLPATYLAKLVPFHDLGKGPYWVFVLGVGAAIGLVTALVGRRWSYGPLIGALGAVFGLLVLDVVVFEAPLQINTVFGYSPTVAGRFAGFGNLAFAQLASSAILLGVLLAKQVGGRRGPWVAVGVFAVAIVADGAPMWGSDVGGVLSLVPGAVAAAFMLLGIRLRWRTVVVVGPATAAAIAVFAGIDLARPPDARTHLGRLVADIGDQGFGAFETVVLRKLDANLSVLAGSVWTHMVPVVLAFVIFLLWRAPGRLRADRRAVPEALVGLLVVRLLGFALNDSGIAVPGVMLGVINASLVYLVMRAEDADPEDPALAPAPGASSSGAVDDGPSRAPDGEGERRTGNGRRTRRGTRSPAPARS